MARAAKKKPAPARKKPSSQRRRKEAEKPVPVARRLFFWGRLLLLLAALLVVLSVAAYRVIDPRITPYMLSERQRLGAIAYEWVDLEQIAPVMGRSVVAAEDANFCLHWGFDMAAIRKALDQGGRRGASTISQQVVKNAYLWQGRSWLRKALEALITPLTEALWTKRRILEVYLNIAEFGDGVFGVGAASRKFYGIDPASLTPVQAARLAAVLPDPKGRSAARPSAFVKRRARAIADGAATIRADGRAACFED